MFSITSIIVIVLLCLSGYCSAFGAGNVPTDLIVHCKVFRHRDIEDILTELVMRTGSSGMLNGAIGFAGMAIGKKFGQLSTKRVYFGNWLRDYSQLLDAETISKGLDVATLRLLVWLLGFISFGYATIEFEVTEDRLGVYRPEEHIDNPKDYADNRDARQLDPRLRGPVDPGELLVDPRTGLKNYIANEQGGWTTSSRYIRDSLLRAIELGRQAPTNVERYEALRLLGQALHCLEDLPSHSNWVELALIELGYTQVFPHVGRNTQITILGSGKLVWPLVTGTYGSRECVHAILGDDPVNQISIADLNDALIEAQRRASELLIRLETLLKHVPLALKELENMQLAAANLTTAFSLPAEQISRDIYPIFELRDKILTIVYDATEKIPGLQTVDEIRESLKLYVLLLIQPLIRPVIQRVSQSLTYVIPNRYIVWDDDSSTDPTHYMLAKDHLSCYLNEPAGQVAKVIVRFAVSQVVAAWSNPAIDAVNAVEAILTCFVHPALLDPASRFHQDMFSAVRIWTEQLSTERKARILDGLTREGVRQGRHHDAVIVEALRTQRPQSTQTVTVTRSITQVPATTTVVRPQPPPQTVVVRPPPTTIVARPPPGPPIVVHTTPLPPPATRPLPPAQTAPLRPAGAFMVPPSLEYGGLTRPANSRLWPYNTHHYKGPVADDGYRFYSSNYNRAIYEFSPRIGPDGYYLSNQMQNLNLNDPGRPPTGRP